MVERRVAPHCVAATLCGLCYCAESGYSGGLAAAYFFVPLCKLIKLAALSRSDV